MFAKLKFDNKDKRDRNHFCCSLPGRERSCDLPGERRPHLRHRPDTWNDRTQNDRESLDGEGGECRQRVGETERDKTLQEEICR